MSEQKEWHPIVHHILEAQRELRQIEIDRDNFLRIAGSHQKKIEAKIMLIEYLKTHEGWTTYTPPDYSKENDEKESHTRHLM